MFQNTFWILKQARFWTKHVEDLLILDIVVMIRLEQQDYNLIILTDPGSNPTLGNSFSSLHLCIFFHFWENWFVLTQLVGASKWTYLFLGSFLNYPHEKPSFCWPYNFCAHRGWKDKVWGNSNVKWNEGWNYQILFFTKLCLYIKGWVLFERCIDVAD